MFLDSQSTLLNKCHLGYECANDIVNSTRRFVASKSKGSVSQYQSKTPNCHVPKPKIVKTLRGKDRQ